MSPSRRPPKPASTEQPPGVAETLTAAAAATDADERPGIDSLFPPDGYVVPASGIVAGRETAKVE